jgi:hypothetical protein
MSSREHKDLRMFDPNMNDVNILNSFDDEIIAIASPPIKVYSFNIQKTFPGATSGIDPLYGEADIIDETALQQLYKQGFNGTFDPSLVRQGEMFDEAVAVEGYYQEPTWTQELSRLGIEQPEELAISFNYKNMLFKYKKEIKLGDVIETFRGKVYRVMDAYVADETVGWKYIHFHVIAKKPTGLDNLILPGHTYQQIQQAWGV